MKFNLENEPIDIVYTWVDGSDPVWIDKKTKALEECDKKNLTDESLEGRFENHDELKYSLRSVALYMPWVRNIYIVTDNQMPEWLDVSNPKIKIIDHKEIFPDFVKTPVFNSLVIELFLKNIKGLSNRFIYFNDDFIINKKLEKSDFFTDVGECVHYVYEDLDIEIFNDIPDDNANSLFEYFSKRDLPHYFSRNTFDLFFIKNKQPKKFFWLKHTPFSFVKKDIEDFIFKNDSFVKLISQNQFRSKTDIWVAYYLALNDKISNRGAFVKDGCLFEYALGATDQSIDDILKIWDKNFKFICIAQFKNSKDDYKKIAEEALSLRFSLPCVYEKNKAGRSYESLFNLICLKLKDLEEKNNLLLLENEKIIKNKTENFLIFELQNQKLHQEIKEKLVIIKKQKLEILKKSEEISIKNKELSSIYSSRAWKLVAFIRKILAVLIPVGSRRRKIAGYMFRFFKITTRETEEQKFFKRDIFYLLKRLMVILKKDGFINLLKKLLEKILLRNKIFYKFKFLEINNFSKKNNKINFTIGKEKLSVVVLTLNRVSDTKKAIKYLYKNIPFDFELIILDNGSDKEMINFLKELKTPRGSLKIIYEKENLGCAGGRKKAFALTTGDYVLSIDNDIFVMPFFAENLISILRENKKIAGACCKVVFPNGRIQFNGGDYNIKNKLIDFNLIDTGKKYNSPLTFRKRICGWIPGGATIWRKEVIDSFKIDPEMKGSYEDNDFSFVLKKEGLHLSNSPKSIVIHNHIGFNRVARKDLKYMNSRYSKDRILYAIRTFYLKHKLLINDPIFYSLIGLGDKKLKEIINVVNKK